MYSEDTENIIKLVAVIPIILSLIAILVFTASKTGEAISIEQQRDLSEYTAYMDGEEVDLNKIDLSLYAKRFDDENKVVYSTHKSGASYSGYGSGMATGMAIGYGLGAYGR